MRKNKRHGFANLITLIVLIFTCLFSSSCIFDGDKAVNIGDSVSQKIVVQEDSTLFYFYYNSEERPIEDYQIIKARIEYYVDYHTSMKKKDFFITVPDDVQYEEGQAYFTAKIGDVLTNQSVVYVSVHGNYKVSKSENASRVWEYVIASVVAVILLIVFCSIYTTACDAWYSNSVQSSLVWLGCIILYVVAAVIIGAFWGTGPAGILIGSGVLFFILTLFPFFKYKL